MYESDWVNVYLDDVELPDGTHIEHHVLAMPKGSQTAVVLNDARDHVLLIWRHRFITNKWGWEVPAGWVEPGEDPRSSIRREITEETGYEVGAVEPLVAYDAIPGISSMRFTCWLAHDPLRVGNPDGLEAGDPSWHPISSLDQLLSDGQIQDGPSITALTYFIALHRNHSS